jgi:predicted CXXCH cytochrome family protein
MTIALTEYIKIFSHTNHRWTIVIFIVLVFTFLHLQVQAYDFQACNDCHDRVLVADHDRYSIHSPFAQQQCEKCHAARESFAPVLKKSSADLNNRQKVKWLGKSAMADTSHGFRLPGDKVGDTLVVEARGTDGTFFRKEILVPSLADLAEVQDSGRSPDISDVQVLKIEHVLFLSVTIGWQTDTLTNALVRYGIGDLSQKSNSSIRFGRRHAVTLHNLQPDRTYRFTVVSHDLFGRSKTSESMTFSTSKPITVTQQDKPSNLSGGVDEAGITSSFWRFGTDYLLELTLKQSASLYIGSKGVAGKQELPEESISTSAIVGNDESHAGLSSEIVISMEACQSCHQNQSTATHPVNVYPKPGMIIPPEYPTLPDGRITCNSCHASHSSDYEFRTRKGGKRELCVGCHQDML